MRLAGGMGGGVGGAGVGGTAVVGTAVGGTAVGGAVVAVTTTGVGGSGVLVGSATARPPVVAVGSTGIWVGMVGASPTAGNLQEVAVNASVSSNTHVRMNFLFMIASLKPDAHLPLMIFYIILVKVLSFATKNEVAITRPKLCVIHSDRSYAFQGAMMLADPTSNADIAQHGWAQYRG